MGHGQAVQPVCPGPGRDRGALDRAQGLGHLGARHFHNRVLAQHLCAPVCGSISLGGCVCLVSAVLTASRTSACVCPGSLCVLTCSASVGTHRLCCQHRVASPPHIAELVHVCLCHTCIRVTVPSVCTSQAGPCGRGHVCGRDVPTGTYACFSHMDTCWCTLSFLSPLPLRAPTLEPPLPEGHPIIFSAPPPPPPTHCPVPSSEESCLPILCFLLPSAKTQTLKRGRC